MIASEEAITGPLELDGVADTLGADFKIFSADDVEVAYLDAAGVLHVIPSEAYTIADNQLNQDDGFDVVLNDPGDYPAGDAYVYRRMDFLQLAQFTTNTPAQLQRAMDRMVMRQIELREQVARALTFSFGESYPPAPPASLRAGKIMAFGEDGAPDYSVAVVDMQTAVDAASDAQAAASAAAGSQTAAAGSASTASTAAATATAAKNDALDSANTAASEADSAAASQSAAAGSATTASAAATTATGAAATATAKAGEASTSATNAAASATTANTKAGQAATSETNAAASATAAQTAQAGATAAQTAVEQAISGVTFTWNTGTSDANPGNGAMRANNASLASATYLYIDEDDALGAAVSSILDTWDDSTSPTRAFLILRKRSNPTNLAVFAVGAAITDAGDYRKVPVTYVSHAGSFSSGDVIGINVERTGDKGAAGIGSGDLLAANALSELAGAAATARGNINAAPNSADMLVKTAHSELSAERVVTDTTTITWDWATGGQAKANVPDGSLALTKLANMATQRLRGRNTAGSGAPEEITISTALDWLSSTRGVVTYRGAAGWAALAPGTAGLPMVSGGAGADPSYAALAAGGLGSDAVTTVKILNNNVTLAKIQQITTDRLLGRDTAGTGDVEQLTVGGGVEFTGSGGIQRSALTGDVTASAGSNATTIANNAVTTAKIADGNVTTVKLASSILQALAGNSGITGAITVSTSDPSGGSDGDIWLKRAS